MYVVEIDTKKIFDWQTLHHVFTEAFRFTDRYGRKMDHWIEGLSSLDEETDLSTLRLHRGEPLEVDLLEAESFLRRLPELLSVLVDGAAFVNARRLRAGKKPVLHLVFR